MLIHNVKTFTYHLLKSIDEDSHACIRKHGTNFRLWSIPDDSLMFWKIAMGLQVIFAT